MAQNITLLGASYSDVPGVTLPKTGGGTALFTDVTETTAAAADVASGKYFYTAAGVLTQGTASGGGGSGLTSESGTYTPTSDIAKPTIKFSGSHTKAPIVVLFADQSSGTGLTSSTNLTFVYFGVYVAFGENFPTSTSNTASGVAYWTYRSSNSATCGGVTLTASGSGSYISASQFIPNSNSNSRYWRANRTYKWIAIWN